MTADAISLVAGTHCFSSLLLTDRDSAGVHPDVLPAVQRKYPQGWQLLVFRYHGKERDYHILDDGELLFRVQRAVINPVPSPTFERGDMVCTDSNSEIGVIREMTWHLKRQCICYTLDFDERRSGCWYFEKNPFEPDRR